MIAERTVGGLSHPEKIEELDEELTKLIQDFDRAVNVEALRLAKETGKHALHRIGDNAPSVVCVERELLLGKLKCVEAGYDLAGGCMEGTRQTILNDIMDWVANPQDGNNAIQKNTYWFYGSPGIGKTSLAHSICERLHDQKHLAGAFFCRRDDPNLSKAKNILPTFINKLAGVFPPFRTIVAERLRKDPNLTPETMKPSVFLDFIRHLPRRPKHVLVFVLDAFDECGDEDSRPPLLTVLTDAAAQVQWLRIIITSRPEVDIQRFFDTLHTRSHVSYDLATDEGAGSDLRIFAKALFDRVAFKRHIQSPWPEPSCFDEIISRAAGLFIFVKTIALALEHCKDPTAFLEATLDESAGSGLTSLYGLYSSILKARILHSEDEFRQMIGVLIATAPYRPLCEDTIAQLAGVEPSLVKTWVDGLSSLFYRDEEANREIRVRHLSISDFFLSDDCKYKISLQDAHAQLGTACIQTMLSQLRFNICKLEDSRLTNAEIQDLQSRIRENISDALHYSCLYWSNHLCSSPSNDNERVRECLMKFFEGPCPLFWIEVLSLIGMLWMSIPSLRRVGSTWIKVRTIPGCCLLVLQGYFNISLV